LKTLFADSGYQGPNLRKPLAKVSAALDIEIVNVRSGQRICGLAKTLIVERTIAWLNRCEARQGLENLNRKALAFLRLASIRLNAQKTMQSG